MLRIKTLGALSIFLLIVLSFAAESLQTVSAASPPPIVQFTNGTTRAASGLSVGLNFTSPVNAGNILVICAAITASGRVAINVTSLGDSMGVKFYSLAKISKTGTKVSSYSRIWYGTVTTSGTEHVKLSYSSGPSALYGYEIAGTGLNVSNFKTSKGSGAKTTTPGVATYTPAAHSLVIACGGFANPGTIGAGTGYVLDAAATNGGAEHLSGTTGTPTNSNFITSAPVNHWTEVSASIA